MVGLSAGLASPTSRPGWAGQKLTRALGQQVVERNRPGGNGFIGVTAVTGRTPDGYTLLGDRRDVHDQPALFKDMPLRVDRDLLPITMLRDTPTVSTPWRGALQDRRRRDQGRQRQRPGKIARSPGNGPHQQLRPFFSSGWGSARPPSSKHSSPTRRRAGRPPASRAGEFRRRAGISSVLPDSRAGSDVLGAHRQALKLQTRNGRLQESGVPAVDISNGTRCCAQQGQPPADPRQKLPDEW